MEIEGGQESLNEKITRVTQGAVKSFFVLIWVSYEYVNNNILVHFTFNLNFQKRGDLGTCIIWMLDVDFLNNLDARLSIL